VDRGSPEPNGYTWTYASILGDMLHLAEKTFGERDQTYTILGVEFSDSPNAPQTWYPGNRRQVVVQLTADCIDEPARACLQMSDEVVHLLSPTGGRKGTLLEDGLAEYFRELYMRDRIGRPDWTGTLPAYKKPLELVKELMKRVQYFERGNDLLEEGEEGEDEE
jgi:hypothetical protein